MKRLAMQPLCFVLCITALMVAYHAMQTQSTLPCMLCTLQRWTLLCMTTTCVALLILEVAQSCKDRQNAVQHTQRSHTPKWHRASTLTLLIAQLLLAKLGLLFAGRQWWLQWHPTHNPQGACLPGLDQMLQHIPWHQALQLSWGGHGDCGDIAWRLLGVNVVILAISLFAILWIITCIDLIHHLRTHFQKR